MTPTEQNDTKELRKAIERAKANEWASIGINNDTLTALLDRLERAEAAAGAVPEGYVLVPKMLTVEIALALQGRDGIEQAPGATYVSAEAQSDYDRLLAAAPSAPVAAQDDALDAKRHRYTRATTTAIRDPETGERIEVTPEMYDAAIDRAMARDPLAVAGIKAKDIAPVAAQAEPGELENLRAENDKLRDALADKVCAATMLTDISIRDGGLNMAYQGGAAQLLAEQFGQQFEGSGAVNYLEIGFNTKSGMRLLVTLQRCDGKTPSQLQREAEAKLAEALATPPAPMQEAGKDAWEYSFIHSSALGRGDEEVGPCLTYDEKTAFGVGCIKQRKVSIRAIATSKEEACG